MDANGRLIERVYLEFREGKSSKFYAVILARHDDGTQSVSFNFGRIGFPRGWDERARRVPPEKAAAEYATLVRSKLREGYKEVEWPQSLQVPADEPASLAPPFCASAAGVLPGAGAAVVAGVAIPKGSLVKHGLARADHTPRLWMTGDPVPFIGDLWTRLAAAFPETGLWPLIVDDGIREDALSDPSPLADVDIHDVLESAWTENVGDDDELGDELSPFSRGFPGLAAPTTGAFDASAFSSVATQIPGRLGLVAVTRPADTVAAIGWTGWANYDFDAGAVAQVFRSWEERFGAVLVGLGFDILTFGVGRPARNLNEATAIAAEHFAVAYDDISQGAGSIRDYARDLVHAKAWPFWWD